MIIEKIEIESFASYKNAEFEFSDGINLIEGSNESGKSSIADFIKFILYGAGGKGSDSHLSERRRVMNFNDSHIAGSMTVRTGERRLRITRNTAVSGTVRESVRTRITVTDTETGQDLYDGREPGLALLGIPEDVFSASVYLRQGGERAPGEGINESISNILFSGDERLCAQKAIERIERARIPLSHKHGNVGRIHDIRNELSALTAGLAEQRSKVERIITLEASINEKKKTNGEHREKYTLLEKQKKAHELALLIESCEALEGAERELLESEMRLREYKAEAHIPFDDEMEELRTYRASLRSLDLRMSECRAQKAALELEREQLRPALRLGDVLGQYDTDITEQMGRLSKRAKKRMVCAVLFTSLAAVSGVAGAFLHAVSVWMWIAAALTLIFGVAFFSASFSAKKEAKRILDHAGCEDMAGLADAIVRYDGALDRAAELDGMARELDAQLAEGSELISSERERLFEFLAFMDVDVRADSPEALETVEQTLGFRQRHCAQLEAECNAKRAYYDALLSKTENADVERARAQLAECGVESPLELDRDKLSANIKFYREQSELLTEKIHSLDMELTELRAVVSSPSRIQERISHLELELAACERKHAVYTLAADSLRQASEELRRSVAPTLARISGGYMDTLTDGKYAALSLDPSFTLSYESGGELRHIDHMSTGTQDMAYLSLRFALADVISDEGGLFTVLDEATAHLDDTRAGNLIALLCSRAEQGRQHILFTCHSREARLLSACAAEFNYIKL